MLDKAWQAIDEQAQTERSGSASTEALEVPLTQPEEPTAKKGGKKAKMPEPPTALKTCTVYLEDATVELVEGQPVRGLTRQERGHLKFHGFIK